MGYSKLLLILLYSVLAAEGSKINYWSVINNLDFDQIKEGINSNISEKCATNLMDYVSIIAEFNFTEDNLWALQMLDSSAKIPDGIFSGSLVDIGNFDECLDVEVPTRKFSGQHCMLDINLPLPEAVFAKNRKLILVSKVPNSMALGRKNQLQRDVAILPLFFGVCIPSTCTAEDINWLLQTDPVKNLIDASVISTNCYIKERELSSESRGFIAFMSVLVLLAAISTLYELHQIFLKNEKPSQLLSAFSLYCNTKGLFEIRDSSGEMACLHGMRTLSMMWVLLGHVFLYDAMKPAINLSNYYSMMTDFDHVIIFNSVYSVDSFFFMSGLLVAFVFFRNIGRSGTYDVPVNYIHRYLRLTPCFLIMILFTMSLQSDLTNGPLWNKINLREAENCKKNWWGNLLYLLNYINPDGVCVGQAWYLMIDMQLFWIAPLILYPLYFWPKIGISFLAVLTLGSTLWTFGIDFENKYSASFELETAPQSQFGYEYIATHKRLMPWLVGLALGFAVSAIKARKITIRMSKMAVFFGWLFSTVVCLGILYGLLRFEGESDATYLESAFYLAFTRTGWGIGLAWVVFACIFGYGGYVNSILSMGIFQPLGKLSYNVYLTHLTIINYRVGAIRTTYNLEDLNSTYEFLGTLILSYLFAAVLYLLAEAPIAIIDRQLLRSIKILPYPNPSKKFTSEDIGKVENGDNINPTQDLQKIE